jgi:CBS domain containing-hemolysin-like protein
MQPIYTPLPLLHLKPQTGYQRPFFGTPKPVRISDCALEVMTDLNFVPAAVVRADIDAESATQIMIARGVRSLLVADAEDDVIGIVTSRDLIGDRPLQAMHEQSLPFGEIRVKHIMTPAEDIEVIPFIDVLHARVGDIVMTLKHSGRQHALVVDDDAFTGQATVRGIFSATQIARQLGIALEKHELSRTFAEIDRAVQERQ